MNLLGKTMQRIKELLIYVSVIVGFVMLTGAFQQSPVLQFSWDYNSAASSPAFNIAGRNLNYHAINWSLQQGALSACTLLLESSPDSVNWISQSSQDCTTSGSALPTFNANYVRLRTTVFTISSSPAKLTVNWNGYTYVPGSFNSDGSLTVSSPIKVVGATNKYVNIAHDGSNGTVSLNGTGTLNLGSTNNVSKLITSLGTPGFSNPGESWIDCTGTLTIGSGRYCRIVVNDSSSGTGLAIQTVGKNFVFFERQTVSAASYTSGSYTVPAGQDGSYYVNLHVVVTTAGSLGTNAFINYTDETNTARVLTIIFYKSGATNGTFLSTAASYAFLPAYIRAKAGTSITCALTGGTYTGSTYNAECSLTQVN